MFMRHFLEKLLFRQHRDPQFLRLIQLASRRFSGHEETGLLADASRSLSAKFDDHLLDFRAAQGRQRAGDDNRLAGKGKLFVGCCVGLFYFHFRIDADRFQFADHMLSGFAMEKIVDRLGDRGADLIDVRELFDR